MKNFGKIIGGREGYAYNWIPRDAHRILDVGCANGYLISALVKSFNAIADASKFACGVDVNFSAIKDGKKLNVELPLITATSTLLPLKDNLFDVVTLLDVIEHLSKNEQIKTIAEISRVIKPHGTFILSGPYKGLFYWLSPINFKFFTVKILKFFKPVRALLTFVSTAYHRHYTLHQIRQIIGNDFKIENIHRGGLLLYPLICLVIGIAFRLRNNFPGLDFLFKLLKIDFSINYRNLGYNFIILTRSIPKR